MALSMLWSCDLFAKKLIFMEIPFYSDPGFTLVVQWSGHVSVDVGSCLLSCLHPLYFVYWVIGCVGQVCFRLVVFGSLVLLPRFLDLRSSEELVARARVEFVSGGSSQSGFARASDGVWFWTWELHFLARAVWFVLRSSERSVARACLWLQTWGFELLAWASILSLERTFEFLARARTSWLEREFSVFGRSSDKGFARASVFYISGQ